MAWRGQQPNYQYQQQQYQQWQQQQQQQAQYNNSNTNMNANNGYGQQYRQYQQQQQQYPQQNNPHGNRLMNAYQSAAPPVASPFLQAQQQHQQRLAQQQQQMQMQRQMQMQMQQQQQQQQGQGQPHRGSWNPVQQANMQRSAPPQQASGQPGAAQPGGSEVKLIPDTPPDSEDDADEDVDVQNNNAPPPPPPSGAPGQQQQQQNGYYAQQRNMSMGSNGGRSPMPNGQQYPQQQQYAAGGNMATAQQQMQQLIASQQKMIDQFRKNEENLRKQLRERDDHWRQTLQNSLNKKDLRINELFQESLRLQEESKKEQMKVVELRQQMLRLKATESSLAFSTRRLPGLPQKGKSFESEPDTDRDSVPPPPPPQSAAAKPEAAAKSNTNASTEEEKKEDVAVNKTEKKTEADKSGGSGIETGKSKEDTKNALSALFGARSKPKSAPKTETKEEENKDDGKTAANSKKVKFAAAEQKKPSGDNPALAKYNKMKKIGMPEVSIINKMRMDGCSKDLIAEFTGEKKADEAEEEDSGPTVDLSDAKFDKYKKMKKLNMPINSVINKMRMDGCTAEEIEALTGTGGGGGKKKKKDKKKDKKLAMQELAVAMGLRTKELWEPSKVKKLKRIHWKVIELKDIKGTFWEKMNKQFDDDKVIVFGAKFELDFQVRARKPRLAAMKRSRMQNGLSRGDSQKKRDPKDKITWIQGKRDQNIQIGLKTMGMNNEEIYDAIVDMDDEKMTLTRLETIYELTPDLDEQHKAEEKVEALGDEVEFCGPSEMFHIEMSTIPEVRTQVTKWLFCKTFKEIYTDRLQQVTNIIKACQAIKESRGLHMYLRILLRMGNMMNHGILDKCMAYGFDLDSLALIDGVKNFSGNKTLAMFLYEFAYNRFFDEVRMFDEEMKILNVAIRTETTAIETSIKAMADEFLNIDLFCRRLHDEYHPGDTEPFREYMAKFSDLQSVHMMNLKVKIQNAQSLANNVAAYYGIKLDEGKPENLFIIVHKFVMIMDKARRQLIKLEKERQKMEAKRAKEREKKKKKKGGGMMKKMKISVAEMLSNKKKAKEEEEEKGNALFNDIKAAANKFHERQKTMEKRLSVNFMEKKAISMGQLSPTMDGDPIKKRLSSQMNLAPMSQEEIEKIRVESTNDDDEEEEDLDDHEMQQRMNKVHSPVRKSNNLMVPT